MPDDDLIAELEALAAESPKTDSTMCSVQWAIESNPDHADLIFDAIESKHGHIGHNRLSKWLETRIGVRIPGYVIGRHRRGDCLCRRRMAERYTDE